MAGQIRPPAFLQTGGLPRSAPEKALTIKRTTNTTSSNLAMDAANPAIAKKPIYAAISARMKNAKAQPSIFDRSKKSRR